MKPLQLLCIWILRKTKCTVIIGTSIDGDIKAKYRQSYLYDNNFSGTYTMANDKPFSVPEGKFNVTVD